MTYKYVCFTKYNATKIKSCLQDLGDSSYFLLTDTID